jgi:DNA-binding protein
MVAKKTEEVKEVKEKKTEEVKEVKEKKRMDDNVVYVGQKPTMSYVLAVITQFSGGLNEVHLKARGRSISRAVDVAEIVRNRFLENAKIQNIEIGTEEREVEEGNKINVSTIDIKLVK